MYSKEIQHNIQYYLLLGVAFFLPLSKKVVPIIIILIVLNWLIGGEFKSKFSNLVKPKYALLFMSFYFLHLIGLIYTDNLGFGWFDMEIKLSLMVFPLVFFTSRPLEKKDIDQINTLFILGCLISGVYLLLNGLMSYLETKDINSFLYGKLSMGYHTSYYSMYLCLSLAIIMFYIFTKWNDISLWKRMLFLVSKPVFLVLIVLLMSKSGIITLVFVVVITIMYLLFLKKIIQASLLLSAVVILLFTAIHLIPETKVRIVGTIDLLLNKSTEINPNSVESTAERLLIWPVAIELISEHPLVGVGTGDIRDELIKKYIKKEYSGVQMKGLNVHNQFLQTFAALGLFGFLSIAFGFILPLFYSIKKSNFIYAILILIIIINALTESVLEVQAGVIFYAFFNSLYMFLSPDK